MTLPLDIFLKPLARLLIARGVLFSAASRQLKHAYIRGAEDHVGGAVTDSRLSVMTGLQRRDLAKLREERETEDAQPRQVNHLSRLVAKWQADPKMNGAPLPRRGDGPSFDTLARSVRQDVHPKAMLDQLVAAGTVAIRDDDTVELLQPSYQPLPGSSEQLAYLFDNVGDHLAAATENLLAEHPPHFERAVHYNQLSEKAVTQLDALYRERQMALLQELNAAAAELQASDPGPCRFRAGGYFYSEEET